MPADSRLACRRFGANADAIEQALRIVHGPDL